MDDLEKALLKANPGSHVRSWGVIDESSGTYIIKATCRRCGDHGEFSTQAKASEFKEHHTGTNNKCPHEKDVRY